MRLRVRGDAVDPPPAHLFGERVDVERRVVAAEAEAEAVLAGRGAVARRRQLHPAFVRIGTTSRAKLTGSAAPMLDADAAIRSAVVARRKLMLGPVGTRRADAGGVPIVADSAVVGNEHWNSLASPCRREA